MSNLPQFYFGDIPADEMKEIADGMAAHADEIELARCESRNHREHQGELWQCAECLRVFCWEEDGDHDAVHFCDDCWCRLRERRHAVAFA